MKYGFQNSMLVELKDNSDKSWIFYRPLLYVSKKYGPIEIPTGFETDFSSVPRVPVAYQLWGNRNHREGALHDYIFRKCVYPELSIWQCSELFMEAMKSRGVSFYIRYPMYYGVCIGSFPFYKKRFVWEKL